MKDSVFDKEKADKETAFYHDFNKSLQSDAIQTKTPAVFWQNIHIKETAKTWEILADGRSIQTPEKNKLTAPNARIAALICEEWQTQKTYIRPRLMPLSRLMMTIIDKLKDDKSAQQDWLNAATSYLETDFLLFPSPYPKSLRLAEDELWNPLIAWASSRLNHDFKPNITLSINTYNKNAQTALLQAIESHNIYQQMAFVTLCQSCGSALLALAATEKNITEDNLIKAALVQEHHQSSQWGEDAELTAIIENKSFELKSFYRFLQSFS